MSFTFLMRMLPIAAVDEPGAPAKPDIYSLPAAFTAPYLNYESKFVPKSQPEFIFPEGASPTRGRFELAFSYFGSFVMLGAGIGGTAGFLNGLRSTAALQQTGHLKRTQLLNHVLKQGTSTANTFGSIALMYMIFGMMADYVRGKDDHFNTIFCGSATGLLYKSTVGLRKCAIGGLIGFGLSTLYTVFEIVGTKSSKYSECL